MHPRVLLQISPIALLVVSAVVAGCDSSPTGPPNEPVFVLVIQPSSAILHTGRQLQLKVRVKGAEERVRSPADVHWSSTDDRIAKVTPGGMVTAGNSGSAQIHASWEGHQGYASVQVIDRATLPPCPVFSAGALRPNADKGIPCTTQPSNEGKR